MDEIEVVRKLVDAAGQYVAWSQGDGAENEADMIMRRLVSFLPDARAALARLEQRIQQARWEGMEAAAGVRTTVTEAEFLGEHVVLEETNQLTWAIAQLHLSNAIRALIEKEKE